MSRRDIETVCTLAAHLAQRTVTPERDELGHEFGGFSATPQEAAEDAMYLQRLGRRAMRALNRAGTWKDGKVIYTEGQCLEEFGRIEAQAAEVLDRYEGLKALCGDHPFVPECLEIQGLPTNHPKDSEGYCI